MGSDEPQAVGHDSNLWIDLGGIAFPEVEVQDLTFRLPILLSTATYAGLARSVGVVEGDVYLLFRFRLT